MHEQDASFSHLPLKAPMIVMITRRKHKIPDWYGITVEFECRMKSLKRAPR